MTTEKNKLINIISNYDKRSQKISKLLIDKLEKENFIVKDTYSDDAELNICIGGDGSFLRAVHKHDFPNIPFIGINTGHLGFFQEILPQNIDQFVDKYFDNDYVVEEILLVKAKVCTTNNCFQLFGINEIVIKAIQSKVIHLEVFIDQNHLENFSGDGIIVSTPVGSTAYNFASGGSIVYPSLNTLQVTPLSPINSEAYRSLPNSTVVPGNSVVTIKPEYRYEDSILIIVDGIEYRYDDITKINFSVAEKTIYKLNFDKNMYWNNLKSKFL